jgi:hypothetical protein
MEVIDKINLEDSNEFWNVDEHKGYRRIRASDNRYYKVWVGDRNEKFQKNWWYDVTNQQEVAETLAQVRKDLLTLLVYLEKNPDLWMNHPIAFGIYHTFDLHLTDRVHYMEMRPNKWGGLGLNKPKELTVYKMDIGEKKDIKYNLGTKRGILLTLRNQQTGEMKKYTDIIDLAIHELTHTTCNDTKWIPESQGGNHREPYPSYHRLMRKWSREAGIL